MSGQLRWDEVVVGEFVRLFLTSLGMFVLGLLIAGLVNGPWPIFVLGIGVGVGFPVWWGTLTWRAVTGRPLGLDGWHVDAYQNEKIDLWQGRRHKSTWRVPAGTIWGKP